MGWTKRQLIESAFDEMAMAGYVFDIQPEEMTAALQKLDAMVGNWYAEGLRLGYAATVDPKNSDPDQDSGLPEAANEPVYLNLAKRLAPSYGKTMSRETLTAAKEGLDRLRAAALRNPPRMQYPRMTPAGAGNRGFGVRRTYLPPPCHPLTDGTDDVLDIT